MRFQYYSNVSDDGHLQKNVSEKIKNELKAFKGKRVEITIEKLKSKRSIQQNRYYWLLVGILSKEIGYDKNELHEIIKFKFLRDEKVFEKTGEIFEYIKSTTELNKTDFADFTTDLIRWSSETFGVVLPLPGEQLDLL